MKVHVLLWGQTAVLDYTVEETNVVIMASADQRKVADQAMSLLREKAEEYIRRNADVLLADGETLDGSLLAKEIRAEVDVARENVGRWLEGRENGALLTAGEIDLVVTTIELG